MLKSGIHATLAGVITALAVPMFDGQGGSPLGRAEHALHPWVAYLILPVFAFVNAGVSLAGVTPMTLMRTVALGIAAGLVAGKTVGVCVLCGVGFTMSLFIGSLAFGGADPALATQVKIGVIMGSLVSVVLTVGLVVSRSGRAPTE